MPWPVHPNGLLGAQGDQDSYRIERSLRFNSADSAYLNRTPASAGNRKTWTWSGWVKRNKTGQNDVLFDASNNASTTMYVIRITSANDLEIGGYASSYIYQIVTTQLFRDLSAWYHIVVAFDTTEATASNRVKLYVNGSQVTSFSASSYPTLNFDGLINNNVQHRIGSAQFASQLFDGYLTEINFIDGQALTPSSFGETDAITGRWKAKAYSGTYGTNGFYLKFADNSGTTATTLGKDSSGNGNNWTPNNFSVTAGAGNDSLVDSPTNYGTDTGIGGEVRGNYCTLSGIDFSAGASGFSLANGNLQYNKSGDSGNSRVRGTIFVGSGKYYWEYNITSVGASTMAVGVATTQYRIGTTNDTPVRAYLSGGNKLSGATGTAYGSSWTANDVIGVALDMDAGSIVFYKNNSSQGTAFTDLAGSSWTPWIQGEGVLNCNFGQRPFAYTAPSGFKALCTTNLPQPTIQKPSRYMDVLTWSGTGSGATRSFTGLGFSPDLVWTKTRNINYDPLIYDAVRGAGSEKELSTSQTLAEGGENAEQYEYLSSFDSNGFTASTGSLGYGYFNESGKTYVAWAWDEAPIAGMDIVSYTGDGNNNRSVPHNLGVVPSMVIIKSRNYGTAGWDWVVYHKSLNTSTEYLLLNSTAAKASASGLWAHTSSNLVFPTAYSTTNSAGVTSPYATFIAYLFAEVEGFSKFGSYTGNGSSDGPFVWCGFRPRWVMIKYTTGSISNINNAAWLIVDSARDTSNVVTKELDANNSSSEATVSSILDFTSNGFKIRWAPSDVINSSGATYIFAAFAESPFKYARAR